ncbi:MAG TPA: AAA family ATPase [Vicinamibacterales bacterium]|nr:AAA family ATPase [Vicinamibacterales bacterium]
MSVLAEDQTEVTTWLADASSHAERPATVERIDTHSASVFLAGTCAYKMKRAVRYSFLDFSTLDLRRQACEAEVRLNRRTASNLYRGVIPVTREPSGRLALGGEGTPVEWLVVMGRFPQDCLLDRVAQAGRIAPAVVSALADAIASFHAGAAPTPHRGGVAGMSDVIIDNARALAGATDRLPAAMVSTVTEACAQALAAHGRRLDARRAGGFVRQCHGDLHLRNIVLLDGAPTLFDAIEFNDDFACIDVWYDTAFLLMDLLARSLAAEANALFNQYLLRTSDVGGLPLMPFFLGCRAAVRAKTSLAAAGLETDGGRRRDLTARAREYLELAAQVLAPGPCRVIAIGGLSGTGKSTLAARLAPRLGGAPGAVVVRSDVLRKVLLNRPLVERLGPDGYTAAVTEEVYRSALVRAADVLNEGWPVIVDATFLDARWRRAIGDVARSAGVPFTGLWLEAPPEHLADRLRRRTGDASDATEAVLFRQLARERGGIAWTRLDADGDPESVARAAFQALSHG